MPRFEIFFKSKDEKVHIKAKTFMDAFDKMCDLKGIGFIMVVEDLPIKELYVSGMFLILIIKNVDTDTAIAELWNISGIEFTEISAKKVQANISFKVSGQAVQKAQELISQGWKWHNRYEEDSCNRKNDPMRQKMRDIQ